MNILIVHAHNEEKSFNASMKNLAVETFNNQGDSVVVSDLYAMDFNPVASADDFKSPKNDDYLVYALEQRNAYKTSSLASDIEIEIEKIKSADLIIFNFPMYWFSMPAIMKGWIDRVFISGYCYGGTRFYDRGGLKGKKAMLSFSLGGREHMFGNNAIHGEMDLLLRPIMQGMLAYVGLTVLPPFIAYHVPYISDDARREVLDNYQQHLQSINQLEPLTFPSLEDFDERLYPK